MPISSTSFSFYFMKIKLSVIIMEYGMNNMAFMYVIFRNIFINSICIYSMFISITSARLRFNFMKICSTFNFSYNIINFLTFM